MLTYQLFVGEVSLWIRVILVLVLVFRLLERLHEFGVVLALQVGLVERLELLLLGRSLLVDAMQKSQIAYGRLDNRAILLQSPISERQQILKRLEREAATAVLVIVIVILYHMLGMQLHILEFFERSPVIFVHVVRTA